MTALDMPPNTRAGSDQEDTSPSAGTPDVDAIVQRLFAPLTSEQQKIVDVTAHAFFANEWHWPTFQHVQAILDRERLDARTILSTFPVSDGAIRYGAFTSLGWIANVRDETELELTLLGLHHYSGPFTAEREALARDILRLLQVFIEARRTFTPPATQVQHLQITSDDALSGIVRLRGGVPHNLPSARVLAFFVGKEPPFFASIGGSGSAGDDNWTWTITRGFFDYEGVDLDIQRYVRSIVEKYHVPQSAARRVLPSPLSLPTSLGYLDTVWRVVHGPGTHLVVLPSPDRAAALAFDAATREEFLERVTALADVLKCLSVPSGGDQRGGHALGRLRAYLAWKLPAEAQDRVSRAIDQLGNVNDIRNAGGHADADTKGARAYRALGLTLPVTDWPAAWQVVRVAATEAFDSLRDELLSFSDTPAE